MIKLLVGGFALVFQVQDQSGRRYALKRLAVNNSADLTLCKQEIAVMVSPSVLMMITLFIIGRNICFDNNYV